MSNNERGEIAAYEDDEGIICHRVKNKYSQGGKIFYEMQGINKETNPIIDESPVSEVDVIGRVTDTSIESMILMEYSADRGIIPQYDVLGMPNEVQNGLLDLSKIDGSKFIEFITKMVTLHEREIIDYLLENPHLEEELKFGKDLYSKIDFEKHPPLFKRSRVSGFSKIELKVFSSFLGIPKSTYYKWKSGRRKPWIHSLVKIYLNFNNHFSGLKLHNTDQKFHEIIFSGTFVDYFDRIDNMIVEQLRAVLAEGVRDIDRPYNQGFLRGLLREDFDVGVRLTRKNIKSRILNLLRTKTGADIDKLLGTQDEDLFINLFRKYFRTNDQKKDLAKTLDYLSFGSAGTNYKYYEKIVNKKQNFRLLTTHDQYIYMLTKSDIIDNPNQSPSHNLKFRLECIENGHISFKTGRYIIGGSGCVHCTNFKNEKLTIQMVYDMFREARSNGEIKSFRFHTAQDGSYNLPYYDIFGEQKVKSLDPARYYNGWDSEKWTIDGYVEFSLMLDTPEGPKLKTFFLGIESDGKQHQFSGDGYKQWIDLSNRLDTRKNYERWKRFRIDVDRYKDILFTNDPNKFLIRVPTYAGQGSVENRMIFIIWCFKRLTRLDFQLTFNYFKLLSPDSYENLYKNYL